MTGDREIHPNLADALGDGDGDVDAAPLDDIARRLPRAAAESVAPPPPDLFDRIRAELDGGDEGEADARRPDHHAAADLPPVVTLAERRRRPAPWLLGAAAAVVAIVVGVAVTRDGSEPQRQRVELAALAGFEDAQGSATLEVDGDARSVRVDLTSVDVPSGSHLELWLLDPEVEQLVALGEITGDGPHRLDDDVDLGATPIVDVSLEPDDGDPSHSGVSVLRGTLDPA